MLVDRLTVENRQLAETAAMWQARAQMLDEWVRMLEAPKPEPAPDPSLLPIPPTPNVEPWDARWQARVMIAAAVPAVLALAMIGASAWVPRLAGCAVSRRVTWPIILRIVLIVVLAVSVAALAADRWAR